MKKTIVHTLFRLGASCALLALAGCAAKPHVINAPLRETQPAPAVAQLQSLQHTGQANDTIVVLAFSGGGTRAAALSYGVMQALRDTPMPGSKGKSLLNQVDAISAVSGGSFTAAYYALRGDALFTEFEPRFLRRDIEGELKSHIFSLGLLFSSESRSQRAMKVYDKRLFQGARFRDLQRKDMPILIINASDLGQGARFSYTQEYFDLLCSDVRDVPLSHAVTASSAVPLVFSPVLLKNYADCDTQTAREIRKLASQKDLPAPIAHNVAALKKYITHTQPSYLHLVDGGITDNLGLRAIYDLIAAHGGPQTFWQRLGRKPPKRFVIISVDSMRSTEQQMDAKPQAPSLLQTVQAVTDIQIDRYSADTLNLMAESAREWVHVWSAQSGTAVELYFMHLHFKQVEDARLRDALYLIPTSFTLPAEQVDELIATGGKLLRSHPDFKRLLRDLGASQAAVQRALNAENMPAGAAQSVAVETVPPVTTTVAPAERKR